MSASLSTERSQVDLSTERSQVDSILVLGTTSLGYAKAFFMQEYGIRCICIEKFK